MQVKHNNTHTPLNFSRRNALKTLSFCIVVFASPILAIKERTDNCHLTYDKAIPFEGVHQLGVLTPEQKNSSFIALNVMATTLDELQSLFKVLTQRIAYLTQVQKAPLNHNDKMPPLTLAF